MKPYDHDKIYIKFGIKNVCDDMQIIKKIQVENINLIEDCVIAKMKKYKTKDGINEKEYYKCSYKQLLDTIISCIRFYENKTINLDVNFDINEIEKLRILRDEEYDKMCNNRKGGNYNKYMKYKLKM